MLLAPVIVKGKLMLTTHMDTYNDTADTPVKFKMAELLHVSDNGYSSEFMFVVTKSANWMFFSE